MSQRRLFLGCFLSLIATAFGFVVRGAILGDWAQEFDLDQTEKGAIIGAGLYPFAISIILFSLIVDRIGYGWAMVFAFLGHFTSALMTIFAKNYESLYFATFLFALSNGVVEAVINPVVATIYEKNKTHWLNILHAGWPGGLVLGGLLAIAISYIPVDDLPGKVWQWQMALVLIPTVGYGLLLLGQKFPVQERVAAGVSYLDMLKEFGAASCLIVCFLLVAGLDQILQGLAGTSLSQLTDLNNLLNVPSEYEASATMLLYLVVALIPTVIFALVVRTFGRPMFVFLLLVMFLLATTELGTDSWIADIMRSVLNNQNQGTLFLVYTSFIMFVLRFFAGPIVHRTSPLGLLAMSAAIATAGLFWLSNAGDAVGMLFLAATLYGFGKTFFWPTTLGVISEQYPRGGALMLNAIAGVGMLAVGTIGGPVIGSLQDQSFDQIMREQEPGLHAQVISEKTGLLGKYHALDQVKMEQLPEEDQATVKEAVADSQQGTLATIAILPAIMFVCYLILIAYFRSRGGYQAQVLTGHAADDEKFTGGIKAPVEA